MPRKIKKAKKSTGTCSITTTGLEEGGNSGSFLLTWTQFWGPSLPLVRRYCYSPWLDDVDDDTVTGKVDNVSDHDDGDENNGESYHVQAPLANAINGKPY